MNPAIHTRCWAEIDREALRHNARAVRAHVGRQAELLAVVKADGYGHGMAAVARALREGGDVRSFAVANAAEAVQLRAHLPDTSITILSPALPEERPTIVRENCLPWVSSLAEASDYARLARESGRGQPFEIIVAVDTGMGREGVLPDGLPALLSAVEAADSLRLGGIITHLPSPDEDAAFTTDQLRRYDALLENVSSPAPSRHAQNSAGLLGFPLGEHRNVVRPGLSLYGVSPLPPFQALLCPALTLKTRVTLARTLPAGHGVSYGRTFVTSRPTRVGTLAAGYADGYPRHLSNVGAQVLVRGRRCAVLGRVTMDQIMVDLDALPEVDAGEEVVLLGRQGPEEIPAAELAAKSGTIPWEIFTGISARVGRYYFG